MMPHGYVSGDRGAHDERVASAGYESWFVSARDPGSLRALWIRHTRNRPAQGPASAALWCTVAGGDPGGEPVVVKQVFGAFPADSAAGPEGFRGRATMGGRTVAWDLSVSGAQPPLRPLRPAMLYRAPLPRTKLEVAVPDGLVAGVLDVDGRQIGVSGWRGTIGHNWGAEHADSWVWLHADGFGTAPDAWLELVLARIRIGRARSPWTAMGALCFGGERLPLGGLGRRPQVDARPGRLTASVPSPGARLGLVVVTDDASAVAVPYADPRGGSRVVRHAVLARVELTLRRRDGTGRTLSSDRGAYEYGGRHGIPGVGLRPLPEG